MYQNKNRSKENSSIISNEAETKLTDIFEQIQKKSEEFPSSEGSIKILKNLSNPTNLTNPQIIMDSKYFEEKLASRRNNNIKILKKVRSKNSFFSTRNSPKNIPKTKSEISIINQSSNVIKNDISKIFNNINKNKFNNIDSIKNISRNKIILKRIEKQRLNNDKTNNIINNSYKLRDNKSIRNIKKDRIFHENLSASVHSLDYGNKDNNIWEKLRNSKVINPQDKNKRVNELKNFNKNKFKNETYFIKLFQYHSKTKAERYEEFLINKDIQNKSLNETIQKIEKLQKDINNNYNKRYISYINFLRNYIEKENIINHELMKEKNQKIMENRAIQKQIYFIKEKKKNLIKWLYLQIKVKEKLTKLPDYYKYIIEDNIPLFEINKNRKNKIMKIEYNKILDYKGKNIYEDIKEFFKEYEILEIKAFKNLVNNKEIQDLDSHLKDISKKDKSKKILEDNIKRNQLLKDLKIIKNKNIELIKLLQHVKNKNITTNENNNKYLSNLSDKMFFLSKIDNNNTFYYKKGKTLIYNLVLFLYKWVSQNKFKEIENYSLSLKSYLSDEKNILKILEYSEIVINLLLEEKQYYYSNKKLKEQYNIIERAVDKEIKREKIMIQLKIQERDELKRKEIIKEKINKKFFKYYRKIDYDYFRKEINKKNRMELNKMENKETRFEDFFYDYY